MHELQKQTMDRIAAYDELYRHDSWGLCEHPRRRWFEQFVAISHYEKANLIPSFSADEIIVYYTRRYSIDSDK